MRFRNKKTGLALDLIRDELNEAEIGVRVENISELAEFLQNLEKQMKKLDAIMAEGKVPVYTQKETTMIQRQIKDVRRGIREGRKIGREEVKSAKEILDRRRAFIRAVRDQFGLSDDDLKFLIKFLMPGCSDKTAMLRTLREDDEILEGMLSDEKLFKYVADNPESVIRV